MVEKDRKYKIRFDQKNLNSQNKPTENCQNTARNANEKGLIGQNKVVEKAQNGQILSDQ